MQDPESGDLRLLNAEMFKDVIDKGDNLGLLFAVGEVVQVKDGRFRIVALGRHFMRLEGVPQTTPLGRAR